MSKTDGHAEINMAAPHGMINLRSHSRGTGSGGTLSSHVAHLFRLYGGPCPRFFVGICSLTSDFQKKEGHGFLHGLLPITSRKPSAESWLSLRWSGPNGWHGEFQRTAQST
jgi:hypothetical protein